MFAVEPIVYAPDPRTGEPIHIGLEHDVVVTADGCDRFPSFRKDIRTLPYEGKL